MPNTTWKDFERRVAKRLGGRRIPVTGERHGADVEAGPFVYQMKNRRGLPSYLNDWLDGIVGAAAKRGPDVTGVVVWRSPGPGVPDDNAVVLLRLRDWIELHGE